VHSQPVAPQEVIAVPECGFPVDVIHGVAVVTVPEEVDITNAAGLRSALLQAVSDGHSTLVVDMTGTVFCDSAGLHVLVDVQRRARADGGEMLLALSRDGILRTLEITGIGQLVPSFTTLDEALARATAAANGRDRHASRTDH
jgi:anti-anti-sigma factor